MTISSEMTVQCLSGMIRPSIILVKTGEKLKEKKKNIYYPSDSTFNYINCEAVHHTVLEFGVAVSKSTREH